MIVKIVIKLFMNSKTRLTYVKIMNILIIYQQ